MRGIRPLVAATTALAVAAGAQRAAIPQRVRDPYVGAIVLDAADGRVLFEDRADEPAYPASILKLMDLLLILEDVDAGRLRLSDLVTVTAEAAGIGGSQVWLKERETFSVEELLHALVIQSANDAAVALALHAAGTRAAFVARMNERARSLGMTSTVFHSVHGLPPARGQEPDITTARDLARLCLHLARRPEVFRYTSVARREFRGGRTIMETHNPLLTTFPGCDGFKTGYFAAGGYSIAVTAQRDGARAIAVVLGSPSREVRNRHARDLLASGLAAAARPAPKPILAASPPAPVPALSTAAAPAAAASATSVARRRFPWRWTLGAVVVAVLFVVYRRQQWGR